MKVDIIPSQYNEYNEIILLYGNLISSLLNKNKTYSYELSITSIPAIRQKIDTYNNFNVIIISNNVLSTSTEEFVQNFNNEISKYITDKTTLDNQDYWENILSSTINNLLSIYGGIYLSVTVSFATINKTIDIDFTNKITVSNSNQ